MSAKDSNNSIFGRLNGSYYHGRQKERGTLFAHIRSTEGIAGKELEDRFARIARSNDNFLYLRGYVESFSGPLYATADLFLMPSSFEPCGISQMLSMRAGHPCVVHAIGGLKDTVKDGVTGFVFDGGTPAEQAENFVNSVQTAITTRQKDPSRWQEVCYNAADQRFSWEVSATTYKQRLYHFG